ncbi:hypothetical protein L3V79_05350 [Thiotrichales bacterium 19S9-12]|nr:hypothetical protein [Thiotrichales bacterium 19S9-11]MCF6811784.1 hypothetical protein [Thiotrichales bacterium 19S9-12]
MNKSEILKIIRDMFQYLETLGIKPFNQESTFREYSNNIQKFFESSRSQLRYLSPRTRHHNIIKLGGGRCGEFSELVAYELRRRFNNDALTSSIEYEVKKMGALMDHNFVRFKIKLANDQVFYGEVDFWTGEYREITKEEYNSLESKIWGRLEVEKIWNNDTPLTTNDLSEEVRTIINPLKPNRNKYKGRLPQGIYPNENRLNINLSIRCLDADIEQLEKCESDPLERPITPFCQINFNNPNSPYCSTAPRWR